jgi:proline iminopeptidase
MRFPSLCVVLCICMGMLGGLTACIHTEPFRDHDGRILPGSVATMEMVPVGGTPQSLWIRGEDAGNPALVLLHGGPGTSESALFRHYDALLEAHFLVVYWEQRGAGRSYHGDLSPQSMTVSRLVQDLDEVVDLVRSRFKKQTVMLMGHSWGTVLGTTYAAMRPDKVAVYIGIGQVADMPRGERLSYDYACDQAILRHDRSALRELDEIGPPPHSVDSMLTSRKWVERFGGAFHGALSTGELIWSALRTDEANWIDLLKFGQGNRFSLTHLWQEFSSLELDRAYRRFEIPVVFILERYDQVVPSVLAERYFRDIEAPFKRLIWFEQSAHNPPFEEPERFVRLLIDDIRPLALTRHHSPSE